MRIDKLKSTLGQSFAITDLGLAKKILCIQIDRDRKTKKVYFHKKITLRSYLRDLAWIKGRQ